MSDNPFAAPNTPDPGYVQGNPQKSPGALMAILIICLVLGILGSLGACMGGVGLVFQTQISELQANGSDPAAQKLQQQIQGMQRQQFIPSLIMIGLNFIVAPLLAVGAIGGLNRKPWGHRLLSIALLLAMLYAVVKSILTIIVQIMTMNSMSSMIQQQFQQQAGGKGAEMMGTVTSVAMAFGIGMTVVWGLILIGFYFWSWSYLRKDNVQRYFGVETA